MASLSVSIVIPVWNEWHFTKDCLETLRPTLGMRDEVIIVDNGSTDNTSRGLKQFPNLKIQTNEENLGFAVACNQGAALAKNDIVVFLNNDTLLPSHWLDDLIAPFDDETVYATGPRSNLVNGKQQVAHVLYASDDIAGMKRFAKRWQNEHRGSTVETDRLVGFCIAVRRDKFNEIGQFDEQFEVGGCEDDDLCLRLVQSGGKLLIAHGSYVHHHGHATFDGNNVDWYELQKKNGKLLREKHGSSLPESLKIDPVETKPVDMFISACMIVKDEEELLPACLKSLNQLVDEVVIYDTGSTDRSIKVARACGANVIEGYWDDDFSRARNEALKHCKSDWILWIDADEVYEGDPELTRHQLMTNPQKSHQIEILNLSSSGHTDMYHTACRMFRREDFNWLGRLHEQVVATKPGERVNRNRLTHCRLVHSGYLPEQVEKKNKSERNLRLALLDQESVDGRDDADKLCNLARSYLMAGKLEQAMSLLIQARELPAATDVIKRAILRAGAQTAASMMSWEDVIRWADDLEAASKKHGSARYYRGIAYTELEEFDNALEQLSGMDEVDDDDDVVYPIYIVRICRARAYAAKQRWAYAADEFNATISASAPPDSNFPWMLLIKSYTECARDFAPALDLVSEDDVLTLTAQSTLMEPESADKTLEVFWNKYPNAPHVLAAASRMATKLSIERAIEWSVRLRSNSLDRLCPLTAMSLDPEKPFDTRTKAASVVCKAFKDNRAELALRDIASTCPMSDFQELLNIINEISPEHLEVFIVAAVTTGERSLAMAQQLHGFGATEEAVAVMMHGMTLGSRESVATQAAEWLDSIGHAEEASQVRSATS